MNCDDANDLLAERLMGPLPAQTQSALEAHLAGCASCRAAASANAEIWADFGRLGDDVPHERMRARFHAALAAYEQSARANRVDRWIERIWPRRPALQAALAASLLVVGVVLGQWTPSSTDREVASLRAEVRAVGLALLSHPSASERLRAVDWARRAADDGATVEALLETVRYDPSINVRLAALDALGARLDKPEVGRGLTDALERTDAPLLQVTLASMLLDGHVTGSAEAIARLLERNDLDPAVREYLESALADASDTTTEA